MALHHESTGTVLNDLKVAISNNDVTGVTRWFETHPYAKAAMDTDTRFEDLRKETWTLLKETTRGVNSDIFDVMLENVYDPYVALTEHGEEPFLVLMFRGGTISCLEKLINRGFDLNAAVYGLRTPLTLLVKKPFQIGKIEYLVSRGADLNKLSAGVEHCPLHYAVGVDEELELIPTLIKLGADVNLQARLTKVTPLHLALEHQSERIMDYLLEKGANPRIMSCEGETALDQAVQNACNLRVFLRRNVITQDERNRLLSKVLSDWIDAELKCLELLLQTGSRCYRWEWAEIRDNSLVTESIQPRLAEVEDLLEQYSFKPRTLLDLSCFEVREVLSTDLPGLVNFLPLPDFLKKCVKLDHYLS